MPLHEMTMDGFQADLNVLLSAVEAKAKACDSGSSHSDCSQFSFNLFKNVYAFLNFSIIHHGASSRATAQYVQKSTVLMRVQRCDTRTNFARSSSACNACGVVMCVRLHFRDITKNTTDSNGAN